MLRRMGEASYEELVFKTRKENVGAAWKRIRAMDGRL